MAKIWQPDFQAQGIVQISHGMCEYIDRYAGFAEFLTENGFIVCANNHLGHGASAASQKQLGYFAKRGGEKFLVDDLHTLTNMMKIKYPDLPILLFGHSMGSFIARNYVTKYGKELSAVIFCGTSGARRTKFDWLSRDEKVVDQYLADPYCDFTFTASAFEDLFTLLLQCSDPEWFSTYPKTLPTLLISGDMDPVGDYGKGVSYVYKTLISAGVRDVRMKLYEGARHELLNEINRQEVYEDILQWISHLEAFGQVRNPPVE